jgi:hypothetical protein
MFTFVSFMSLKMFEAARDTILFEHKMAEQPGFYWKLKWYWYRIIYIYVWGPNGQWFPPAIWLGCLTNQWQTKADVRAAEGCWVANESFTSWAMQPEQSMLLLDLHGWCMIALPLENAFCQSHYGKPAFVENSEADVARSASKPGTSR